MVLNIIGFCTEKILNKTKNEKQAYCKIPLLLRFEGTGMQCCRVSKYDTSYKNNSRCSKIGSLKHQLWCSITFFNDYVVKQ